MQKEKSVRILISGECNESLERMLQKVNKDNLSGNVKKNALVCWLLIHAEANIGRHLDAIRRANFDELSYLKGMIKQIRSAKRSGQTPPDLQQIVKMVGHKNQPNTTKVTDDTKT